MKMWYADDVKRWEVPTNKLFACSLGNHDSLTKDLVNKLYVSHNMRYSSTKQYSKRTGI